MKLFLIISLLSLVLNNKRNAIVNASSGGGLNPPSFSFGLQRALVASNHQKQQLQQRWSSSASAVFGRRKTQEAAINPSSSMETRNTIKSIPTTFRGGTAVVAKTMTARQFEMFNLFSGGVAGTVAACITNPLEVIKVQLQSSTAVAAAKAGGLLSSPAILAKNILERDGVSGFFRGLPPTLVGIIPARSAYFYAYQRSKVALGPYLPEGSPGNALISGLLAGIAGNTLTNPIFMVRTRMQLVADSAAGQKVYSGYGECISTIYKQEGIKGFYKGITASYWGCSEGALQFLMYEQLKKKLITKNNQSRAVQGLPPTDQLSKTTYFCSAAIAKMLAAIATYPHEVARTRIREQAVGGVFKYTGMWQSIGLIAKEEGRQGLYGGMGVHLMKVVPNSAFMFLTYEVVRLWLGEFTIVANKPKPSSRAGNSATALASAPSASTTQQRQGKNNKFAMIPLTKMTRR